MNHKSKVDLQQESQLCKKKQTKQPSAYIKASPTGRRGKMEGGGRGEGRGIRG